MLSNVYTALAIAGGAFVTYDIARFIWLLYVFFLRPSKKVTSFGKWAVVTGATDGIGKALAIGLAKRGMNVLLISRTKERLEQVRDTILADFSDIQVRILTVDFNVVEQLDVQKSIQKALSEIEDIGVLVNNVGVSNDFPELFDQISMEHHIRLIHVNMSGATIMTKLVLPGMTTRKRGVILNLSSGSASLCVPLLSVYAATKSYMEHLTVCLASEYEDKNVHIQCHNPMFVSTKLAGMRNSTFFVPSPKTYAEAALANLGYETVFSPYWPHALQLWIFKCIPVRLWTKMSKAALLSTRERAMRKLEKKAN
uniref:Estradiol 17betadehydrogenase putative n=1 Tax=Albugo laibachii Nc14 TaxID=890382 RepID=F0W9S2_9STRA|nr:estradiol 17betadehydrogenase putative [Albugo laibachii Nc14]|eukprot:CCA17890.1 estradiol 17betadehydrogenase putative [Albugo laibachii Nc14]